MGQRGRGGPCGRRRALDAEFSTRRVLDLPGPDTLSELGGAVERVLSDDSYRREARRIADATQVLPPVDAAVDALAAMCGQGAPAAPEIVAQR